MKTSTVALPVQWEALESTSVPVNLKQTTNLGSEVIWVNLGPLDKRFPNIRVTKRTTFKQMRFWAILVLSAVTFFTVMTQVYQNYQFINR